MKNAQHLALEEKIVDGKFEGMKVYSDWFDDLVVARAMRDKTEPSLLCASIIKSGHYAVRGYTRPAHPTWGGTMVETYKLRRDGRVECSGPNPTSCILASEPLGLLSEDPLEDPGFKNWFGSSQVVDEDGQPLVLFHGSGQEDLSEVEFSGGWWSDDNRVTREFGPVMYMAYLKIEKPAYDEDLLNLYREFSGRADQTLSEIEDDCFCSLKDVAVDGGPFCRFIISKGYDGISVFDDSNGGPDSMAYVPLGGGQIKFVSNVLKNGEAQESTNVVREQMR